jgi:hypothetical protein
VRLRGSPHGGGGGLRSSPDNLTLAGHGGEIGVRCHGPPVISVTALHDPGRCYHRGVSEHEERLGKLAERISAAKEFL